MKQYSVLSQQGTSSIRSFFQEDLNPQGKEKLGAQVALLNDAMDNNSSGVNNSKESIFVNEDKIACEEGQGICAHALVVISVLLIFMTLPFSLCLSVKVVQVIYFMFQWWWIENVQILKPCSGI